MSFVSSPPKMSAHALYDSLNSFLSKARHNGKISVGIQKRIEIMRGDEKKKPNLMHRKCETESIME
jgi:hypothetical protein